MFRGQMDTNRLTLDFLNKGIKGGRRIGKSNVYCILSMVAITHFRFAITTRNNCRWKDERSQH